jgi:dTMP kinase
LFIVLEGLDSAGKKTQIDLLFKRLKEEGHPAELLDFPAYHTSFGSLVAKYLRGDYGPKERVIPEIVAMLYALDRYQFRDAMKKKLRKGKVLISNRYSQSNYGFQGAKFSGKEQDHFIKWMEALESRLPQPDIVIFLDMPPEAAAQLITGKGYRKYLRGKKKDIHERDIGYQGKVRKTYLRIAEKKGWMTIKCAVKKGGKWSVKKPAQIHGEIWDKIKWRL